MDFLYSPYLVRGVEKIRRIMFKEKKCQNILDFFSGTIFNIIFIIYIYSLQFLSPLLCRGREIETNRSTPQAKK
tara:strand:+ start:1977 stop:2198 length:222 start_codon:yes stop_codon:yes gene_type:complete